MNDQFFKPKKVTSPYDNLDRKAYQCITGLFCNSRAITDEIKYHDKTSNIDGFIQLIDEDDYPIGNIFVQAKTYKSKYKGHNKAEIPAYFIYYASSVNNEVCIFLSVESDTNKIYWKYISDDYINEFVKSGVRVSHIYSFSNEEIITKENTDVTIEQWIKIVNDKKALYQRKKKSAEEYITENISAFQLINTDFHTLQDSFIERKEILEIYKWIKEDIPNNEPRLKMLVGNAGIGKSVVIKKVIQKLEEDGFKYFAIKADRLQKAPGQTDNEQFEMLRITFASLIQEERAVLIIDQIDALSQYITNDRAILDNVKALIDLFSTNESSNNVRIIVSCRSFDLEFDPKLSLLSSAPKIELKELNKDEVKHILNRLKQGLPEELDETTLSILQTPQHLNLFCKVYLGNRTRKYTSITDLYDELWMQKINLSNEKINKSQAEQLLYELAITIYKEETITPQWNYSSSAFKEVNYLKSQGLIQQFNNKTSFFHQSMYDYVFARYYTKEKRSFIQDLLEEKRHQGLFVRSTINLVLDYERAKNDKQYKENVKTILFSGKIRPHIQLMFLWALSNKIEILPFEKKCIKELFSLNQPLFYSFIKRTYSKEWFDILTPLILNDLKTLKEGDIVYENISSYLWNHVQTSTGEVFSLIDLIKDEITRNTVARNVLRATPDYSLGIVTKWYKIVCDNLFEKAIFLDRALPSNPQFVLGNISELMSHLIKNEKESGAAERTIEEVCNTLVKEYPDDIYPILRNVLLETINSCRVKSLSGIIDHNNAFPLFNHGYSETIHEWFIGILRYKIHTDSNTAICDIRLLLAQKESSCYEYAFDAMIENPILFSDDIMTILKNYELLDEILTYGDKSYYFLELIKKWFTQVASKVLDESQELIYNFESKSDSISKKDRSYSGSFLPYLGYNQRKLVWSIPEKIRNSQIKRLKLELDRKFGKEWNNEKTDHDITAASICGGLMSTEQYRTVSFEAWKKSFYGIKHYANGKHRFLDENVHADAFKQCVSERPEYFRDFVFSLFDDERIPDKYKLAGLEGLTIGDHSTKQIIPFLWKLIDSFDNLSNEGRGYRLFELINRFTSNEGEHIDKIIEFLKRIILSEHESKYDPAIENSYDESAINATLNFGINSISGHAIASLAQIGKQDRRKEIVYSFFLDSYNKLCVEQQLAVMFNLRRECYDHNLYSKIMLAYANRPIADYLYINSEIMHWFWCNDPERIHPYFKMILPNKRARIILVQILFFGMEYEKSKDISKEMFEYIISQDETEILRKIIPLAYKNIDDDTYGQQSEIILRRFANDNRDEIRQTYFIYCNKLPNAQIKLFKDLLESWITLPLDYGCHEIIRYIKKCCNDYPDECYQCVKLLLDSKGNKTYFDEEELIIILFSCYRSFLDYGEDDKADEVMDVFDSMMLSSYSNQLDKILIKIEENS